MFFVFVCLLVQLGIVVSLFEFHKCQLLVSKGFRSKGSRMEAKGQFSDG